MKKLIALVLVLVFVLTFGVNGVLEIKGLFSENDEFFNIQETAIIYTTDPGIPWPPPTDG